jgi:DegV family protein with EDD domain
MIKIQSFFIDVSLNKLLFYELRCKRKGQKMKKIAIITDSGSGLNEFQAKQWGIYLLPLQVSIEDKVYRDGVELSTEDVYEALREGKYPKTSSPIGHDVQNLFNRLKDESVEIIISISISSGLSGTQQMLKLYAETYQFKFHQIETFSTCMIQQHIAIKVKQWINEGKEVDDIMYRVNVLAQSSNTLILPSDLNHLKNGGRLTPLAASLASMLKIRPVLHLNAQTQGKIDVLGKIRTDRKALEFAIDTLAHTYELDQTIIHIIHSDDSERAVLAQNLLVQKGYQVSNISISAISAVIASHTGLSCLGLQFIPKYD